MPLAGFSSTLKIGGPITAFTGISLTAAGGQVYQLSDVYQVVMPSAAIVVYDNGAPVSAADIADFNYLRGTLTFRTGYVVTGPVTADFSIQSRLAFAGLHAHSTDEEFVKLDRTVYVPGASSAAKNSFHGLQSLVVSCSSIESTADDLDPGGGSRTIIDTLRSGDIVMFEDAVDGLRAFMQAATVSVSSSVDGRFEGEFTFRSVVVKDITFGYDTSIDQA